MEAGIYKKIEFSSLGIYATALIGYGSIYLDFGDGFEEVEVNEKDLTDYVIKQFITKRQELWKRKQQK